MHDGYDVIEIERKWQARWRDEGTYEIDNDQYWSGVGDLSEEWE